MTRISTFVASVAYSKTAAEEEEEKAIILPAEIPKTGFEFLDEW